MSSSSEHARRMVDRLRELGGRVFSSGEHACKLLGANQSNATSAGGDPYSISEGNHYNSEMDIRRNAFREPAIYFFNGRSFGEQLREFYNSENIKERIGCDQQMPFETFITISSTEKKPGLIFLVELFFKEQKLSPQLVNFLINGLNQLGFLDLLSAPLVTIFAQFNLSPDGRADISKSRKYEIFLNANGTEIEVFQAYNITEVKDIRDPDNREKQDVKTVAHIKAWVNECEILSASAEFHASGTSEKDQEYAARLISSVTPKGLKLIFSGGSDSIIINRGNMLMQEKFKIYRINDLREFLYEQKKRITRLLLDEILHHNEFSRVVMTINENRSLSLYSTENIDSESVQPINDRNKLILINEILSQLDHAERRFSQFKEMIDALTIQFGNIQMHATESFKKLKEHRNYVFSNDLKKILIQNCQKEVEELCRSLSSIFAESIREIKLSQECIQKCQEYINEYYDLYLDVSQVLSVQLKSVEGMSSELKKKIGKLGEELADEKDLAEFLVIELELMGNIRQVWLKEAIDVDDYSLRLISVLNDPERTDLFEVGDEEKRFIDINYKEERLQVIKDLANQLALYSALNDSKCEDQMGYLLYRWIEICRVKPPCQRRFNENCFGQEELARIKQNAVLRDIYFSMPRVMQLDLSDEAEQRAIKTNYIDSGFSIDDPKMDPDQILLQWSRFINQEKVYGRLNLNFLINPELVIFMFRLKTPVWRSLDADPKTIISWKQQLRIAYKLYEIVNNTPLEKRLLTQEPLTEDDYDFFQNDPDFSPVLKTFNNLILDKIHREYYKRTLIHVVGSSAEARRGDSINLQGLLEHPRGAEVDILLSKGEDERNRGPRFLIKENFLKYKLKHEIDKKLVEILQEKGFTYPEARSISCFIGMQKMYSIFSHFFSQRASNKGLKYLPKADLPQYVNIYKLEGKIYFQVKSGPLVFADTDEAICFPEQPNPNKVEYFYDIEFVLLYELIPAENITDDVLQLIDVVITEAGWQLLMFKDLAWQGKFPTVKRYVRDVDLTMDALTSRHYATRCEAKNRIEQWLSDDSSLLQQKDYELIQKHLHAIAELEEVSLAIGSDWLKRNFERCAQKIESSAQKQGILADILPSKKLDCSHVAPQQIIFDLVGSSPDGIMDKEDEDILPIVLQKKITAPRPIQWMTDSLIEGTIQPGLTIRSMPFTGFLFLREAVRFFKSVMHGGEAALLELLMDERRGYIVFLERARKHYTFFENTELDEAVIFRKSFEHLYEKRAIEGNCFTEIQEAKTRAVPENVQMQFFREIYEEYKSNLTLLRVFLAFSWEYPEFMRGQSIASSLKLLESLSFLSQLFPKYSSTRAIEEFERLEGYLDQEAMSALWLELLLNLPDTKSDNFCLQLIYNREENLKKFQVVKSISLDTSFVPEIQNKSFSLFSLASKNALYWLPEFLGLKRILHPDVRKKFLATSVRSQWLAWLCLNESQTIHKEVLDSVLERWIMLWKLLYENPEITHITLLNELHSIDYNLISVTESSQEIKLSQYVLSFLRAENWAQYGYSLCLMSSLPDRYRLIPSSLLSIEAAPCTKTEKWEIYIDESTHKYKVPREDGQMHEGKLPKDINLTHLGARRNNFELKKQILAHIEKQGHILLKDNFENAERGKVYINERTREYVARDLNVDGKTHRGFLPEYLDLRELYLRLQDACLELEILTFISKIDGIPRYGKRESWFLLQAFSLLSNTSRGDWEKGWETGTSQQQKQSLWQEWLVEAIKCGSPFIVERLLSLGANVSMPDESRKTPLHYFCEVYLDYPHHLVTAKETAEKIATLLSSHPTCNPNAYDGYGTPLFQWANSIKRIPFIDLVLMSDLPATGPETGKMYLKKEGSCLTYTTVKLPKKPVVGRLDINIAELTKESLELHKEAILTETSKRGHTHHSLSDEVIAATMAESVLKILCVHGADVNLLDAQVNRSLLDKMMELDNPKWFVLLVKQGATNFLDRKLVIRWCDRHSKAPEMSEILKYLVQNSPTWAWWLGLPQWQLEQGSWPRAHSVVMSETVFLQKWLWDYIEPVVAKSTIVDTAQAAEQSEQLLNGPMLRIKLCPKAPVVELAAASFSAGLFDEPRVPSDCLSIEVKDMGKYEKHIYAALVSQKVVGEMLCVETLNGDERGVPFETRVNSRQLSAQIISALLIGPAAHYILMPQFSADGQRWPVDRIVGIDNEQAFIGPLAEDGTFQPNILFCLNQMLEQVDPGYCAFITALCVKSFLCGWIREVGGYQDEADAIFNKKGANRGFWTRSKVETLPMHFLHKGIVIALWDRLTKLKKILCQTPTITHLALLKQLNPPLGQLYEMAFEKHQIQERFTQFHGDEWKILNATKGIQKMMALLKEQQIGIEKQKESQACTIEEALAVLVNLDQVATFQTMVLEELYYSGWSDLLISLQPQTLQGKIVNELDFRRYVNEDGSENVEAQKRALSFIMQAKIPFTRLTIADCAALDDSVLEELLKYSVGLTHVEFIRCQNLSHGLFRVLNKYGKSLISLTINQCNGFIDQVATFQTMILEELYYSGWSDSLISLQPQTLQEEIVNELDFRRYVNEDGSENIESQKKVLSCIMQAKTPFTRLTIADCAALDDSALEELLKHSVGLTHVEFIRCQNLSHGLFRVLNKYGKSLISLTINQCNGFIGTTSEHLNLAISTGQRLGSGVGGSEFFETVESVTNNFISGVERLEGATEDVIPATPTNASTLALGTFKFTTSALKSGANALKSTTNAVKSGTNSLKSTLKASKFCTYTFDSLEIVRFEGNLQLERIYLITPQLNQLELVDNQQLIRLSINGCEFLKRDDLGRTPLMQAAVKGDIKQLKELLLYYDKYGLCRQDLLYQVDDNGDTALMLAQKEKLRDVIKCLDPYYCNPYYNPDQEVSQQEDHHEQAEKVSIASTVLSTGSALISLAGSSYRSFFSSSNSSSSSSSNPSFNPSSRF